MLQTINLTMRYATKKLFEHIQKADSNEIRGNLWKNSLAERNIEWY
ncbi:hypothetical protein [Helicobacter anseris]|nr:hypothetical protein [Helicobacter anseris]